MGRGRNIRARKKIDLALDTITSPFTSREMAHVTGLNPHKIAALLKDNKRVKSVPTCSRFNGRPRTIFHIIPSLS